MNDSQKLILIVDDCYEDRLAYKRYLSRDLNKGKTTTESLQIVVRNTIEKYNLHQQLDRSSAQLQLLELAIESANDIVLITEAEPIDLPGSRIVYFRKI